MLSYEYRYLMVLKKLQFISLQLSNWIRKKRVFVMISHIWIPFVKSIKQKQKIIHYEFLLIQIVSSGTHFLFIKMLLNLLSLYLIISILFHRDYTMVEEIRKSDHRPVYCQFILHKNEKKRLLQTNPNLVLRLTNLAITSKTNEKVLQSKVCCPLLSDDMNWEQRCVFNWFHFN